MLLLGADKARHQHMHNATVSLWVCVAAGGHAWWLTFTHVFVCALQVGMRVWPGFSGVVVTSSRLSVASPTRLDLAVENTRVAGSSFGPFLDNVAVPVEQLITQLRGEGAAAASYEVTFVDAQLRVTRAGDQLLLHRRVV